MKDRIREFLAKENKSSSGFAEEIGIQPSGVSHILSGRNKPSLDFVLKMLNTYTELNTEWLLFGRGEMYKAVDNDSTRLKDDRSSVINEEETQIGSLFDDNSETENSKMSMDDYIDSSKPDTDVIERFSEKIIVLYPDGSFREYNRRKQP